MPAGFVPGASKLVAGAEPKVLVIAGKEIALRQKMINFVKASDVELYIFDGKNFNFYEAYVCGNFQSKTKLVLVTDADSVDLGWVAHWLSHTHGIRLVFELTDEKKAKTLDSLSNSKVLTINCEAPTGDKAKKQFLALLAQWYGFTSSSILYLLEKHDWRITECLHLLEKIRLLKQPLTGNIIELLGVGVDPADGFVEALQADHKAEALLWAAQLNQERVPAVVDKLSEWVDTMAKVKVSSIAFKKPYQVANELGLDKNAVTTSIKQIKKFDLPRINKMVFAVGFAAQHSNKRSVLETMVNLW